MGFVTVKHKDGREAEITAGEVDFYQSIGFTPVDGSVGEDAGDSDQETTATLPAPVNGTEQRLDLILGELRGMRADWADIFASDELNAEPIDGETIELREPGEDVLAANPNLTGASDVSDQDGNVIAKARELDASDVGPSLEWSRLDLDAYAKAHGVEDPDRLPNKQAVLDAISAAS